MVEKSMSIWQNKEGYSYAHCNGITKRVGSEELETYKILAKSRHSFWNEEKCNGECIQINMIHLHKKFK